MIDLAHIDVPFIICLGFSLVTGTVASALARGWTATFWGDDTPRRAGRLTFNFTKHLSLYGTLIFPLMMYLISSFAFAWSKPMPLDERNYRDKDWGQVTVALSGPVATFLMACLYGLGAQWIHIVHPHPSQTSDWYLGLLLCSTGIVMNLMLTFFNLLPLPGLSGCQILRVIAPESIQRVMDLMQQYTSLILIILLMTGVIHLIIGPPIEGVYHWLWP